MAGETINTASLSFWEKMGKVSRELKADDALMQRYIADPPKVLAEFGLDDTIAMINGQQFNLVYFLNALEPESAVRFVENLGSQAQTVPDIVTQAAGIPINIGYLVNIGKDINVYDSINVVKVENFVAGYTCKPGWIGAPENNPDLCTPAGVSWTDLWNALTGGSGNDDNGTGAAGTGVGGATGGSDSVGTGIGGSVNGGSGGSDPDSGTSGGGSDPETGGGDGEDSGREIQEGGGSHRGGDSNGIGSFGGNGAGGLSGFGGSDAGGFTNPGGSNINPGQGGSFGGNTGSYGGSGLPGFGGSDAGGFTNPGGNNINPGQGSSFGGSQGGMPDLGGKGSSGVPGIEDLGGKGSGSIPSPGDLGSKGSADIPGRDSGSVDLGGVSLTDKGSTIDKDKIGKKRPGKSIRWGRIIGGIAITGILVVGIGLVAGRLPGHVRNDETLATRTETVNAEITPAPTTESAPEVQIINELDLNIPAVPAGESINNAGAGFSVKQTGAFIASFAWQTEDGKELTGSAPCGTEYKLILTVNAQNGCAFATDGTLKLQVNGEYKELSVSAVSGSEVKLAISYFYEHAYAFVEGSHVLGTCKTPGSDTYRCSVCGAEKKEQTAYGSHKWGAWAQADAGHTRTCSACGASETKAHSAGSYVYSDGMQHSVCCGVCGAIMKYENHTIKDDKCTRCGQYIIN